MQMSIEERINRLERDNRRLRFFAAVLVALLLVGVCLGLDGERTIPDVIQARAFEVVGGSDQVAISLTTIDEVGVINVGKIGTNRDGVEIYGDFETGGAVIINNRLGKGVVNLWSSDNAGRVSVCDRSARELVAINPSTFGGGHIVTNNAQGAKLVTITQTQNNQGAVIVHDGQAIKAARVIQP